MAKSITKNKKKMPNNCPEVTSVKITDGILHENTEGFSGGVSKKVAKKFPEKFTKEF